MIPAGQGVALTGRAALAGVAPWQSRVALGAVKVSGSNPAVLLSTILDMPSLRTMLRPCPTAIDRQTHLRVKIKSLAAEAGIIRSEEQRHPGSSSTRSGLREHRVGIVRREQRSSLLAYAFLRGRQYLEVETKAKAPPCLKRVAKLAWSFGPGYNREAISSAVEAWLASRAEPCGRQPGVMTPVQVGSTPIVRSMSG